MTYTNAVGSRAGTVLSRGDQHQPELQQLPVAPPTAVAVIEGLATGAPHTVVEQAEAARRVAALHADPAQRERIMRVYANTRITRRRLTVDPLDDAFTEFRGQPANIRDRMNLFYRHAVPLAIDVARRALAGHNLDQIGMLVFVTSTGFIAPGVDVALVKQLGLAPSISRVVVNFMGCAAAMNGLRIATDFVRTHPDQKALVMCLELSSINAVFADDINDLIISSLFGDGCAAAVIGANQVQQPLPAGQVVLRDSFSHLLSDAEDGIVLGVNANGITCDLAESLPRYIYDGVDPVISSVLARNGLTKSEVQLWAIHPGGPKIIEQSARSLGLDSAVAAPSWDVLAEYGNMLSVSLLFVLERMVAEVTPAQPLSTGVAFSFAPGVAVEGMVFDIVGEPQCN